MKYLKEITFMKVVGILGLMTHKCKQKMTSFKVLVSWDKMMSRRRKVTAQACHPYKSYFK
jgi:hypothetical protein